MVAKVYADCLEPRSRRRAAPSAPGPSWRPRSQAVAAWFEALPAEWRSYFDHEARAGGEAYGRA